MGSTIVVKSGQLGGNADTFMPIFSVDTPGRGNDAFFMVT